MLLLLTAGGINVKNNPDKTILELEDGTPAWYEVVISGGRQATGIDAVQWARKAEGLGSGEVLLTSMDRDGTCAGYDLPITKKLSEELDIPIIASGGSETLSTSMKGSPKEKPMQPLPQVSSTSVNIQ